MKTTTFSLKTNFTSKKKGIEMGSSLSQILSNICMEHYEKLAIDTTDLKPVIQLRYADNIFVVWPHVSAKLQEFLIHLNSLRPTIQFTT